jgi:hypothetical protein
MAVEVAGMVEVAPGIKGTAAVVIMAVAGVIEAAVVGVAVAGAVVVEAMVAEAVVVEAAVFFSAGFLGGRPRPRLTSGFVGAIVDEEFTDRLWPGTSQHAQKARRSSRRLTESVEERCYRCSKKNCRRPTRHRSRSEEFETPTRG